MLITDICNIDTTCEKSTCIYTVSWFKPYIFSLETSAQSSKEGKVHKDLALKDASSYSWFPTYPYVFASRGQPEHVKVDFDGRIQSASLP